MLSLVVGTVRGQDATAEGPVYNGKPLAAWVDELLAMRLFEVTLTNLRPVRAVRNFGTNAIPWLLHELTATPWAGGSNYAHQNRARWGFWALGEIGAPAIPSLANLLEQQPDAAPSALAGIGALALPALEGCLTNTSLDMRPNGPYAHSVAIALGALFVAIDTDRISTNQASSLLPTIRVWTQSTNRTVAYLATGVLDKLGPKPRSHD